MFAPARVFKNPDYVQTNFRDCGTLPHGSNKARKRYQLRRLYGLFARRVGRVLESRRKGRKRAEFQRNDRKATELSDEDFNALYGEKIHNTTTDELADILIVAATWLHAAQLAGGDDFQPEKSIDVMLLGGAVQFICGRITGPVDLDELRTVVNLKMRYNETRND